MMLLKDFEAYNKYMILYSIEMILCHTYMWKAFCALDGEG